MRARGTLTSLLALVLGVACSRSSSTTESAPTIATNAAALRDARVHTKGAKGAVDAAAIATHVAPPAPPAQLTSQEIADTKSYAVAIARGRAATQKKDYDGAIGSFSQAIVLRHDDARAEAERGYAKLLAGDLAGAGDDFDHAAGDGADAALLAQVWFNTGLVREKTDDADGARSAFAIALSLAPSGAARSKLAGKSTCAADSRLFTGAYENPRVTTMEQIQAIGAEQEDAGVPSRSDPPTPDEAGSFSVGYSMFMFNMELAVPKIGGDFFVYDVGMFGSWPARCIEEPKLTTHVIGEYAEVSLDLEGKGTVATESEHADVGQPECGNAPSVMRATYYDRKTGRALLSVYRVRTPQTPTLTVVGNVVTLHGAGCDGVRFDLDDLARRDRKAAHEKPKDAAP